MTLFVDPANSTTTPLGSGEIFAGTWQDTTALTMISCLLAADETIASACFEWSDDGITAQAAQPFLEGFNPQSFGGFVTAHAMISSAFYRVRIENGSTPQGNLLVQTRAGVGTPTGLISPLVTRPGDRDGAQTSKAVLYGRRPGVSDPQFTHLLLDGSGHLPVVRPPNPTTSGRRVVTADLSSVQLDLGIFGAERKMFTVFNDTQEGTLHIALGVPAGLTDFDYKVPPQHTWELPASTFLWGGDIFGIWDVADGFAQVVEMV